jgi:predicted alpha/beta hydrolase family esterase
MNLLEEQVVFVHGYGMRGFFWQTLLKTWNTPTGWFAPDFNITSVLQGRDQLLEYIQKKAEEFGKPSILVGHSLGGILCALSLSKLSPTQVSHVVILMAPWLKEKRNPLEKLIGFLIRHRLLPGVLVMERFFSSAIPKDMQQQLFSKAVQEDLDLSYEITTQTWFDPNLFIPNPSIRIIGIGSEHDRIVPPESVEALTNAVGGTYILAPYKWGHDDIGADSHISGEFIHFLNTII